MVGYFRRHIEKFSEFAKPMTNLLKQDVKFQWTKQCQKSFEHFKHCLTNPPILQFPDFSQPFNITTDASKVAISAILSQGKPTEDLPIAYTSRTLLDSETRYSTAELELLAILFGVRYFKTYIGHQHFKIFTDCKALQWLYQVKSPNSRLLRWKFKLTGYDYEIIHIKGSSNTVADCLSRYTNEQNTASIKVITRAQTLAKNANPNYVTPEKNRITIKNNKTKPYEDDKLPTIIESSDSTLTIDFPYELMIFHIEDKKALKKYAIDIKTIDPGDVIEKLELKKYIILTNGFTTKINTLVSSLSTLQLLCDKTNVNKLHFTHNAFYGTSSEYESVKKLVHQVFNGTKIRFLFLKNKVILLTDLDQINQILLDFHCGPLAGHQGVKRTTDRIGSQYKWMGMKKDVQNFIKNCPKCQLTKPAGLHKEPMQITSTSHSPFQRLAIDVVGPLPVSRQNFQYILSFQDDLTKFFGAIPIINHTADTIARTLVENVLLKYGLAETILSDRGTDFMSLLFDKIMKLLGIKHLVTSSYHPESNGSLERQHKILKSIIRGYTDNDVTLWPEIVPYAVFVINSSLNRSTGYTPHELIYGYKLTLPTNLTRRPEPVYTYDDYLSELRYKLQKAHTLARENLLDSKIANKKNYDKKTHSVSYKIGDQVLITNEDRKTKLHNPFIGPFEIVEILSDVNIKIKQNRVNRVVHINRTKKFEHEDNEPSIP